LAAIFWYVRLTGQELHRSIIIGDQQDPFYGGLIHDAIGHDGVFYV
jgi:hypothetical protein